MLEETAVVRDRRRLPLAVLLDVPEPFGGGVGEGRARLHRARQLLTIDVYLSEQDAHRALENCLRDEPEWRGLLRVEAIELSATDQSAN